MQIRIRVLILADSSFLFFFRFVFAFDLSNILPDFLFNQLNQHIYHFLNSFEHGIMCGKQCQPVDMLNVQENIQNIYVTCSFVSFFLSFYLLFQVELSHMCNFHINGLVTNTMFCICMTSVNQVIERFLFSFFF